MDPRTGSRWHSSHKSLGPRRDRRQLLQEFERLEPQLPRAVVPLREVVWEQWIFTFDRATGEATLRGGDADWGTAHVVYGGHGDGLIQSPDEATWLHTCWSAARPSP